MGGAIEVDLLQFADGEGILRVPAAGLVKVHSALTLLTEYDRVPCACRVLHSAPFLCSLAVDSREFDAQLAASAP
mgnify:CR=1 FL=1